jgi:hypothetical protein
VLSSILATGRAHAQETAPGPGIVEVSVIPGGATFVTSKNQSPDFGSYDAGAAVAYNFTRIVGVEGEVAGLFGVSQSLNDFRGHNGEEKSPNMLSYSGNVVVNLPGHSFVPYATGGVGGLTVFDRAILWLHRQSDVLHGQCGRRHQVVRPEQSVGHSRRLPVPGRSFAR